MPEHLALGKENHGAEPVRIVYHAGERTFARLFNESSLEEVKNVVRRKLGLNKSTVVVLKQMKSGKLLDLEDDDDFQAFEALLSSSPSTDVEIEVTVAAQSSEPQPEREPVGPSTSKPTEKKLPKPVEASTSTAMTPKRKRTVSFGDVAASGAPKSAEKPSHKKQKVPEKVQAAKTVGPSALSITPAVLPSTVEPPRAEVSKSAEEPSQQKKKKDEAKKTVGPSAIPAASTSTVEPPRTEAQTTAAESAKEKRQREKKAKEPQPAPVVELPAKIASDAPQQPGSAEPPTTEREKEAETSDAVGTSKPATKKQSKQTKDGIAKKLPASVDQEGVDSLVNDSSKPIGDDFLQPASKKSTKSTGEGEAAKGPKTRKSVTKRASKPSVCASIPTTSESTRTRDEVAAAILFGLIPNASGTVQPKPAVPNKPKKKESKKPPLLPVAAQAVEMAVEPESMPDVSSKPTANAPTETALAPTETPSRPLTQTSKTTGPACPICLEHPFHIRYCCPTVLKGPDAIRQRLEELQNTDTGDQELLVKELEALLKGASGAPSAEDAEFGESSSIPRVSIPRTPIIPGNSYLSEVTVENRDEGSSSDSSEDTSADEDKASLVIQERPAPEEEPPATQADLEAVIRGPVSRRQSVLDLIDQVVSDEDTNGHSEEEQGELEEDQDEEVDRSRRQLMKKRAATSDTETEEESRSPSPRPSEAMDDDPPAAVEIEGEHVETPTGVEDGDVVMKDSVADVPVPSPEKQVDDSGEETQVEAEEAMVIDGDSIGVKDAIADKAASPAPVSDASQPPESQVVPRAAADADATAIPPDDTTATPAIPAEADVDPIEPADDVEPSFDLAPPNADPIEVGSPPPEGESLFSNLPHSTPKPGVAKRLKTRSGKIPDSDEHPVSLEQFASEAQDLVTPLPANARTRRKSTAISASQEPVTTRKSARFSSVPPPTTPVAVVLLNRKKGGVKTTKAAKTPAKEIEGGSNPPSQSSATSDRRVAPTPSTIRWETFAEPESSPQVDESVMQVDELVSSPPADSMVLGRPNGKARKGRSGKNAPALSQSSQEKERLFDLTPSQVPFPYSQHRAPAPAVSLDEQESDEPTDSEEEKTLKKKPKVPARKSINTYRSLSQLASQATLYSPRLPTPTNTSGSNGKAKKNVADDSSSSSSESESDETGRSGHIPKNRMAGSVLTKKRKSLLSRM